jgi:hypothetical protein
MYNFIYMKMVIPQIGQASIQPGYLRGSLDTIPRKLGLRVHLIEVLPDILDGVIIVE